MNNHTTFGTLLVLVACLFALPFAAADFVIDQVEVNDIQVTTAGDAVYAEAGSRMTIDVYLSGATDSNYDARIEAWVGGYEYNVLRDTTSIFQVEPGVDYKKTLAIELPQDMEASEDYTLNVEVFDDDVSIKQTYTLRVQEPRHSLRVYDVIFSPSQNVEAGQPLFASVRVENLGDNLEEDIKVTVAIPQLGVSSSEFIDELITDIEESDDSGFEFDEEDAETTDDLMLLIPATAAAGNYDAVVTVEYNRGHSVIEQEYPITVRGASAVVAASAAPQVLVNVDAASKTVAANQGVVYTLSVANLGSSARAFTLEVLGADGWATYRVDPQLMTVSADGTGSAYVYVTPRADVAGMQSFKVRVSEAGQPVGEVALSAQVSAADNSNVGAFKTVLEVGFVVLLIILVILGIVIIAKKLRDSDDDGTEGVEGQTYY